MRPIENDRWVGHFTVDQNTRYVYGVLAFTDVFGSWRADLQKRLAAAQDVTSELLEGLRLVEAGRRALHRSRRSRPARRRTPIAGGRSAGPDGHARGSRAGDFGRAGRDHGPLARPQRRDPLSPRAAADRRPTGGAIRGLVRDLPALAGHRSRRAARRSAKPRRVCRPSPRMGFDTLYMTPIHPIGRHQPQGAEQQPGRRRRTIRAARTPSAAPAGGHEAVAPELGTLDDFLHFQQAAREHGLELALDFAISCSPDHPWVTEHPDWFYHRPDGTIKFAENPPKKYEDIYPLNFRSPDWKNLWAALRDIVLLWAERGVRVFRVDNPHTKPLAFWEWLIREVQDVLSGRHLSGRGVHSAEDDEGARQARLHAELHVLHLAQHEVGAAGVSDRADARRRCASTSGATSSPIRPTFCPQSCSSAAGRRSECGWCWRRRCRRCTASTAASSWSKIRPRGEPGTDRDLPGLGDVPAQGVGLGSAGQHRRRRHAHQPHPPRQSRAAPVRQPAVLRVQTTTSCWCTHKATPDRGNIVLCVVNLDPFWPQSGWLAGAARRRGASAPISRTSMHDLLTGERFTWRGRVQLGAAGPQPCSRRTSSVSRSQHYSPGEPDRRAPARALVRRQEPGDPRRARSSTRAAGPTTPSCRLVEVQYAAARPETYVLAERLDDPAVARGGAAPVSHGASRPDRGRRLRYVSPDAPVRRGPASSRPSRLLRCAASRATRRSASATR